MLTGGATNAVFLEGVEQHRVLIRRTGLFWDNAPAKMDGGKPRCLLLLKGSPGGAIARCIGECDFGKGTPGSSSDSPSHQPCGLYKLSD